MFNKLESEYEPRWGWTTMSTYFCLQSLTAVGPRHDLTCIWSSRLPERPTCVSPLLSLRCAGSRWPLWSAEEPRRSEPDPHCPRPGSPEGGQARRVYNHPLAAASLVSHTYTWIKCIFLSFECVSSSTTDCTPHMCARSGVSTYFWPYSVYTCGGLVSSSRVILLLVTLVTFRKVEFELQKKRFHSVETKSEKLNQNPED